MFCFFFISFSVPDDLTPEEQKELENIRRRKQELMDDIQVMKNCHELWTSTQYS